MKQDETTALIFGKDPTQRVVSVEPGYGDKCALFIQEQDGTILKKEVPLTHWLIYKEQFSPKMISLEGNQPFKYLIEYDNKARFDEVVKASRAKGYQYYSCRDHKEAFMIRNGVTMYKGLKVKDVSILSFDLEHTYGIGDKLNKDGKLLLISNTYRSPQGNIVKKLFAYDEYPSEGAMIKAWCDFVQTVDPSIVVGHNLFGHDLKILRHASSKTGVKLLLGREGKEVRFEARSSSKRKDGSQSYDFFNAHIYGREIIDTFFLAINYDIGRKYESYRLKQMIKQEGLEKADRVHYDASQIIANHTNPEEWEKIKFYAIDDADDALALFDLMSAPFFYATQSIPRSFQAVNNSASGSQINGMMIRSYLQNNHSIAEACPAAPFEGAISFGVPGNHKNVLRWDVSSLYPSVIRQFRIYNRAKDPKALFLAMVNYFTDERLKYKRIGKETGDRYYKDLEQAQKIMINSMYGFMGAGRLNYNYPEGAAQVTRNGREILKTGILYLTGENFEPGIDDQVELIDSDE